MSLNEQQVAVLLKPIKPGRVAHRDGLSNVEGYEIRAHLNRIFGFGNWDDVAVNPTVLLYEQPTTTKAGKDAFKVGYRAERALVIRDHDGLDVCRYEGSAVGESVMPDFKRGDAHDMAIKTAETQALKRAAVNLGDQFGLSLYAKGSTGALVGKVVGFEPDGTVHELHEPDVVEGYDPDVAVEPESEQPPLDGAARFETPQPPTEPEIAPETDEQLPLGGESDEFLATDKQIRKVAILFGTIGIKDRTDKLDYINAVLNTNVKSSKELTMAQAGQLIEHMEAEPA